MLHQKVGETLVSEAAAIDDLPKSSEKTYEASNLSQSCVDCVPFTDVVFLLIRGKCQL